MINVTYAITVCNELKEITKLVDYLQPKIKSEDEILIQYDEDSVHQLLEYNKDVDLFFVPRINTVEGLTDMHVKKWGWKLNEHGWVNFPDYQTRIYRRTSEIEWTGKVHERIIGYNTLSVLPIDEEYCLYHHKEIERQERQNNYYETL